MFELLRYDDPYWWTAIRVTVRIDKVSISEFWRYCEPNFINLYFPDTIPRKSEVFFSRIISIWIPSHLFSTNHTGKKNREKKWNFSHREPEKNEVWPVIFIWQFFDCIPQKFRFLVCILYSNGRIDVMCVVGLLTSLWKIEYLVYYQEDIH